MCGIAGGLSLKGGSALGLGTLRRMLTLLEHRGPDIAGAYVDGPVTLGHARLSIIDVTGGLQPIPNEDETLWVIVNGEIFNFLELRSALIARGHRFRTSSDSEVVLHLYEDMGTALLNVLNGQYAFALWDVVRGRLMLGRDRLGVRPLFYTVADGMLLFASEIKALLADSRVPRRPDLRSLDQVFTYWSVLPGHTMFQGIHEVPAGHYLLIDSALGQPILSRYWSHSFPDLEDDRADEEYYAAHLRELLIDATRLRMRADVPVGGYLSGGLDSSAVMAIAQRYSMTRLKTFSVAFHDRVFDERHYQEHMARHLDTEHHVVECSERAVGEHFPETIWHTETPILRTSPVPLLLLSALVQRQGLKVVLTGEGSDEFMAGYDIFKEALLRRFWAREPESRLRPLLFRRVYDWLPNLQANTQATMAAFFQRGMLDTSSPTYSHVLRWRNTERLKRLFSAETHASLSGYDSGSELDALMHPDLSSWHPLSRAQHLEVLTFLTPYLLSSQGDRVTMAHSVEGRFPFLDHRLVEFAATIPARMRMRGLDEKHILKKAIRDLVPSEVRQRRKRPYRAPIAAAFCGPNSPEYVDSVLAPPMLEAAGYFNPSGVSRLLATCRSAAPVGENHSMALVGILSTQIWHERFISHFNGHRGTGRRDLVVMRRNRPVATAV